MGMIIRVAFNNQSWAGKCTKAKDDYRIYECHRNDVYIGYGTFRIDENGTCVSEYDEAVLCTDYCWPCHRGRINPKRAEGTAFFVFPSKDKSGRQPLTLWGYATIKRTEGSKVVFHPFEPLPQDKWVRQLSAKDILGKPWGKGTYRFIDSRTEDILMEAVRHGWVG